MTADCPEDYPYVPKQKPSDPAVRQGYWDVARGLQAVDGLQPSAYMCSLAQGYVRGELGLDETGALIRKYYAVRDNEQVVGHRCAGDDVRVEGTRESCDSDVRQETDRIRAEENEREADLVSQRIVELLASGAFSLMPDMLSFIHHSLFRDLAVDVYGPGKYKTEALQKREVILNGDSVVYADPSLIERSLSFLFDEERAYVYGVEFDEAQVEHFGRFVSRIWQVHPFREGNTRTAAVFAVLYLRDLGFEADNEPFEHHARFFRDALVRANYRNAKAGIMPNLSFLVRFLENVLNGARHKLDSRDLMCGALYENPSLLRNIDPGQAFELAR